MARLLQAALGPLACLAAALGPLACPAAALGPPKAVVEGSYFRIVVITSDARKVGKILSQKAFSSKLVNLSGHFPRIGSEDPSTLPHLGV